MTRTPRASRTSRLDTLWRVVLATPDRTAEYYALATRCGLSSTQRYLGELEAGRQIVSRLETPDEARVRWRGEVHSVLSRPYVRRKLRYGVALERAA